MKNIYANINYNVLDIVLCAAFDLDAMCSCERS